MKTLRRILVLNNYPLDQVWQEVLAKEKPDHHLFGINHFEAADFQVEIAPFTGDGTTHLPGDQILRMLSLPVGDSAQQSFALARLKSRLEAVDLIYSPCQTQIWKLALMRAAKQLDIPIVCIAHHPIISGRLGKFRRPYFKVALNGVDAFPSLSKNVSLEVNALAGRQLSLPLSWGVDSNFYFHGADTGEGVIAAGRTARDFHTFGQAATKAALPATIVCLKRDFQESFNRFGANVSVLVQPDEDYMSYPQLMTLYAQARVIAIPLCGTDTLCGLTGLLDALGMGKAVIMTRHALIDLDIEQEGIGIFVQPGDIDGWRQAMQLLHDAPQKAREMGKRAKELGQTRYTSQKFAQQVISIFEQVL